MVRPDPPRRTANRAEEEKRDSPRRLRNPAISNPPQEWRTRLARSEGQSRTRRRRPKTCESAPPTRCQRATPAKGSRQTVGTPASPGTENGDSRKIGRRCGSRLQQLV